MDSELDNARKRISEINTILEDDQELKQAVRLHQEKEAIAIEKNKLLKKAENHVADQNIKIDQNQKKLYGGAITNPKDLEDLQLESTSLKNYLNTLEERQLEAMLETEEANNQLDLAAENLARIQADLNFTHQELKQEKTQLEQRILATSQKRDEYIKTTDLPDLPVYRSLRESTGGIAVTIMSASSCSSCGANIPSAIEQAARSPGKLAFCPTCKRILHPG
jgi:predicted  nucleic acid-binding Zn-ribbon protein